MHTVLSSVETVCVFLAAIWRLRLAWYPGVLPLFGFRVSRSGECPAHEIRPDLLTGRNHTWRACLGEDAPYHLHCRHNRDGALGEDFHCSSKCLVETHPR